MDHKSSAEEQLRNFYDTKGWSTDASGQSEDANLWEDLRESAKEYVSRCRLRILRHLPESGNKILDAASGPIQYDEYLKFSEGFKLRVCVDISEKALQLAKKRIGAAGEFVKASLLDLPFPENQFDAAMSLHTIYHIEASQQERAVRELLRLTKAGAPLVVVYANPDRITHRLKKMIRPEAPGPIYYHAHPLAWWDQFADQAEVKIYPWRSLTAQLSRRLIPDSCIGRFLFRQIFQWEERNPDAAVKMGAYPMIVLRKR